METIVLVTGGFDPVHSGHICYFSAARQLGTKLIVGLNSDAWLANKKGRPFMDYEERYLVVANLKMVDEVIAVEDSDGTSCQAIERVLKDNSEANVIFANGGDRTAANIPEMSIKSDRLLFKFAVGGSSKTNSSSWILEEWASPRTERAWGYYRVLHDTVGMKVKELTVNPGGSLSMQRHAQRSEFWMVSDGSCVVHSMLPNGYSLPPKLLEKHDEFKIPTGEWHRLTNPFETPCKIVEIQYGEKCDEEDIERKDIQ
jgi:cytidyltransferase-like protein